MYEVIKICLTQKSFGLPVQLFTLYDQPEVFPVIITVGQLKCSHSVIALEGLGWQQADFEADVLAEGLDVGVLEADLLEVVQAKGAEDVLWKIFDVVSIHNNDKNLHVRDLIRIDVSPSFFHSLFQNNLFYQ